MDKLEFFRLANGRGKTRLFGESDWEAFCAAIGAATAHASRGEAYYWERDAGSVANCYGYNAQSASCGVWVDPQTGRVATYVGRPKFTGRRVPCAYHGGERAYRAAWERATPQEKAARDMRCAASL